MTMLCTNLTICTQVQEEGGTVHSNESPLDSLACHPSSLPFPKATPEAEVTQVLSRGGS